MRTLANTHYTLMRTYSSALADAHKQTKIRTHGCIDTHMYIGACMALYLA